MIPSLRDVRRDADEVETLDVLLGALSAGVPLDEACAHAAGDAPGRRLRARFERLASSLRSGDAVSAALERVGGSAGLVAAARAGEVSGRLAETLASHEEWVEWRLEMRRRTWDAWAQPLLSLAVAAATLVLLAAIGTFPLFVELMERPGLGARVLGGIFGLPQPLPILITCAVLVAVPLAIRRGLRSPRGQRLLESLPLAGDARREQQRTVALREAATLLRSGVPVQDALALAAAGQPQGSATRSALTSLSVRLTTGDAPVADVDWPLLQALLREPPPAERLADLVQRVAAWHESERDRLAEAATRAATVLALTTSAIGCGAVAILAWAGYFGAVTGIG